MNISHKTRKNYKKFNNFTRDDLRELMGNNINPKDSNNNFLIIDFIKFNKFLSSTQYVSRSESFNLNNSKLFGRTNRNKRIRYPYQKRVKKYMKLGNYDRYLKVNDELYSIANFIMENINIIQESQSNTNNKIDYLINLIKCYSKNDYKIENQKFDIISNKISHDQFDYFSFRLKDLSLNYHLNTISQNTLNSGINKGLVNSEIFIEGKSNESPHFNQSKDEKINTHLKKNDLLIAQINRNRNNNVFAENLKNEDLFNNLGISKYVFDTVNMNKRNINMTEEIAVSERKISLDEERNFILTDNNNSITQFSEIEALKNNFKDINNISIKGNNLERIISEEVSSSNFSIQDSQCSSQEKFKKIRGFNFKNNINTKKFSRQILGNNAKISDIYSNQYDSNEGIPTKNNLFFQKSINDKVISTGKKIEIIVNEGFQQCNQINNLNKKDHFSSNSSFNSSSNNTEQINKD